MGFRTYCDMLWIDPTAPIIEFKRNKKSGGSHGVHAIQSPVGSVVDCFIPRNEKKRSVCEEGIGDLKEVNLEEKYKWDVKRKERKRVRLRFEFTGREGEGNSFASETESGGFCIVLYWTTITRCPFLLPFFYWQFLSFLLSFLLLN